MLANATRTRPIENGIIVREPDWPDLVFDLSGAFSSLLSGERGVHSVRPSCTGVTDDWCLSSVECKLGCGDGVLPLGGGAAWTNDGGAEEDATAASV